MEFDDQGIGVPGTYAISVTEIGAWKGDGAPVPVVTSAVCDRCGRWASVVVTTGETTTVDAAAFQDVRVKRRMTLAVYACPEHVEEISDDLCDEFGHAMGGYKRDELAERVAQDMRAFRPHIPSGSPA